MVSLVDGPASGPACAVAPVRMHEAFVAKDWNDVTGSFTLSLPVAEGQTGLDAATAVIDLLKDQIGDGMMGYTIDPRQLLMFDSAHDGAMLDPDTVLRPRSTGGPCAGRATPAPRVEFTFTMPISMRDQVLEAQEMLVQAAGMFSFVIVFCFFLF